MGRTAWRSLLLPCLCAALADGCRPAGLGPKPSAQAIPSWLAEPLQKPAPAPLSSGSALQPLPADVANPAAVFDPSAIVPVLDEPRFALIKGALEREAYRDAAAAFERIALAHPTKGSERALAYQLALVDKRAGMPGPAVKAFDAAAAVDWPLADYARVRAAELLVDMTEPAEALVRLERVRLGAEPVLAGEARLVKARALAALHRVDEAAPLWQAWLDREPRPRDWQLEALAFGRALINQPSEAHSERAVEVAQLVIYQSPFGRGAGEARDIEQAALATLPGLRRQRLVDPDVAGLCRRARWLADAQQGKEALAAADRAIAKLAGGHADLAGENACAAHLARGKALSVLKRYAESSDELGTAIDRCRDLSAEPTASYLAARAALRGGRPSLARQRYAELERRFHDHRLADDARLHGAEAARELGDEAAFTRMLMTIADDYPDGDMVDPALFALAADRIAQGDWAGAILPLSRARKRQERGRPYFAEGRPQYFLARAHLALGQTEIAAGELEETIREFPLGYYMVLAYARLHAIDPARAARALAEAQKGEPDGHFVIADDPALHQPGFLRAVELARQGEAQDALAELEALGVRDKSAAPAVLWASAFLLAKADSPTEPCELLRGAGVWREHYPAGIWRELWRLAYPRPWPSIVAAEAKKSGVPEHLVYAIMREESAFKPRATSPAGAYGLMQLIEPTAKVIAGPLRLPYNEEALKTPAVSIALGSRFLSILTRKFDYDPLLAIAGYNAGPGAPARWVDGHPAQDFDLFVESIPFGETREYVKRVVQSMAAYALLYGDGMDAALVRPPLKVKP